ncbi:MAG: hypothetical protein ABWY09_09750 [Stenotrophomonas maltophilia]
MIDLIASLALPALDAPPDDASAQVAHGYAMQVRRRIQSMLERTGTDPLVLDAMMPACLRPGWRPEVGMAAHLCTTRPQLAALQFIAAVASHAVPADVTLELGAPGRIYVDGHRLEVAGTTTVRVETSTLELESQRGHWSLRHDGTRFSVLSSPVGGERCVLRWRPGSGLRYLVDVGIGHTEGVFPDPLACAGTVPGLSRNDFRVAVQGITEAMEIIHEASASYAAWIDTVIDGVLVTRDALDCGLSSPGHPGLLAVRSGREPLDYVEMIVAAAAQQKLLQIAMITPLGEQGREQLHYLPHRRWYNTSRRALASAHEHHNVSRVLACIAARSGADGALRRRIARRQLMLALDGRQPLQRDHALSAAGARLRQMLDAGSPSSLAV